MFLLYYAHQSFIELSALLWQRRRRVLILSHFYCIRIHFLFYFFNLSYHDLWKVCQVWYIENYAIWDGILFLYSVRVLCELTIWINQNSFFFFILHSDRLNSALNQQRANFGSYSQSFKFTIMKCEPIYFITVYL